MKRNKFTRILAAFLLMVLTAVGCTSGQAKDLKEGDIVFQISESSQSPAVIWATKSPWSHCGIIVERKDGPYVLEASSTVRLTPWKEWKKRGRMGIVKKRRVFDKPMKINYAKYLGKPYDLAFRLGNSKWYCSELVYDIYKNQFNCELGKPHPVSDYGITNPRIRKLMRKRGITDSQLVIAPCDLL